MRFSVITRWVTQRRWFFRGVIPAKAGIHFRRQNKLSARVPAFAGTTPQSVSRGISTCKSASTAVFAMNRGRNPSPLALARGSYFKSKYRQLKSRRGGGRAAIAIGGKLPVRACRILTTGSVYKDLGEGYADKRDVNRSAQHHLRRLKMLGFDATLTPARQAPQAAAA